MKVFLVTFSLITLFVEVPIIIILNIKQNLGHIWLFGPYTLGKLIFPCIFLSIKQTLVMPDFSDHILRVN